MSTKKKLAKPGANKKAQTQPTPLKIKPKAPKTAAAKAPAAAPKKAKAKAKPARQPEAFGDEDEIKIPELDESEERLAPMGAEEEAGSEAAPAAAGGAGGDGDDGEADVPDPFASDEEQEEKGETALGKRQRQTLQEEKAAELRKLKSKEQARRKAAAAESAGGKAQGKRRAVIYVGHIPYGFFESQMKAYFSQFGEVLNIRLSRNKKTGKPKHYAFVEFDDEDVARIVAETMNGYFLYGRTLVVRVVPPEKLHPATFVGANRTWRVVPWRQIAQKQHNKARTPEEAEKRQTRLLKREEGKRKKLAEMGIEYDFKGYQAQKIPKATRTVFE